MVSSLTVTCGDDGHDFSTIFIVNGYLLVLLEQVPIVSLHAVRKVIVLEHSLNTFVIRIDTFYRFSLFCINSPLPTLTSKKTNTR